MRRSVPLSQGSLCAPAGICGCNPLSLLVIMVCSTPRKPPHFLFRPQLLTVLGTPAGCQNNCCEGYKGPDWESFHLLAPSTWLWGSHLGRGSPQGGDPASPREGGRKGKHNPPPSCFSCRSREPFQHTLLWL